jgi:dCMP deaminase
MRPTWEEYALDLAIAAAGRSEDPYMKVGACILRADKSVAGVGYNGAPPGINLKWTDRDERRKYVLHAELNALRYCTLTDTIGGLLAVTHMPCEQCLKTIAAYDIHQVVYAHELDWNTYSREAITQVAATFGISLNNKERK